MFEVINLELSSNEFINLINQSRFDFSWMVRLNCVPRISYNYLVNRN